MIDGQYATRAPGVGAGDTSRGLSRPEQVDDTAIEVADLWVAYPNHLVLTDVNLKVRKGEFVSIIGPSGCGKSTLLMMMAGLAQPTRGSIVMNGKRVVGPDRDWAMVFQHFALLPWRNALDNVMMGMRYRPAGRSKREQKEIALHYLSLVGLAGFEHHFPHQLSGGMQQRVGLARAFAAKAPILLMDEPFASIDAQHAEILRSELRHLIANEERTIAFVTHNIDEALYLSDRVIILGTNPGTVVADVHIDLPHPRGLDVQSEPERERYAEYRVSLWESLRKLIKGVDQ